jgi:lipoprotein-anchoring transpeptidase ErfK/SrfK
MEYLDAKLAGNLLVHGLENGIHALHFLSNGATLWEGFLGRPVSYGCVVLGTYESQLLYDWAEIGTPVEIQW